MDNNNMINIIIIYRNKFYFNKLAENIALIDNASILASSDSFSNILLLCNKFVPDLLIYELSSKPSLNPDKKFLDEIHNISNSKISILATSSSKNALSNISQALENGVDLYMNNLDNIDILKSTLQIISSDNFNKRITPLNNTELSGVVSDLLFRLKLPTHFTGYHYLKSCIINTVFRSSKLPDSTSAMYLKIAEEYGTTSRQVSRAIYKAVCHINNHNDKASIFNTILEYEINPTNYDLNAKELVTLIADQLRIRYGMY